MSSTEECIEDGCRKGVLEETLRSHINGQHALPIVNVQSGPALLALAAFAKTGDIKLAEAIIKAELHVVALIQPEPHLGDAAMELLDEKKRLLCSIVGLPEHQHSKRTWSDIDPDDRPRKANNRALHDASYLTGSRLRVSLHNSSPHFWRNEAGGVLCNGCREVLDVTNDDELRAALYAPAWMQMRWKTFLCGECRERADHLEDNQVCYSCWRSQCEREFIPLRYAEVDNPDKPRQLPLCDDCRERSSAQLATVVFVHGKS